MENDAKIAKLEVNVDTQSVSIAELKGMYERILAELRQSNAEQRDHSEQLRERHEQNLAAQRDRTDRQVAELRKYTDEQVEKLRDHTDRQVAALRDHSERQLAEQRKYTDHQVAEQRKYNEQQSTELRHYIDQQNKYFEQRLSEERRYTDYQVEILRAETARREDKFDVLNASLRNDMNRHSRWTTGAILTMTGLIIAIYSKLLGLY
ncbi:hypothetical protein [Pseudoduganella violaceinigra]|uniref:hypothetical protein n=1 Tax=Pseudoduganella violaceinigra TaxID=246602 RepID=UPI00040CEECC|nr:hypothetical protein [Pseudoduganella violaceinigra]